MVNSAGADVKDMSGSEAEVDGMGKGSRDEGVISDEGSVLL